jgi:hypothetical protein
VSVTEVDKNPDHLYPAFRKVLEEALKKAEAEVGEAWVATEGYRSVDRQLYLYGQGRPGFRPYGRPGQIVTWMKTPKNHGTGLAVDVIPKKKGYNAPHSFWEKLRKVYTKLGLENPAWDKGDFGHIQWKSSDTSTHAKAAAWIAAGFPEEDPIHEPVVGVTVKVNGQAIASARAFMLEGRAWVALRPVTDALGWVIAEVVDDEAHVLDDTREAVIPIKNMSGTGFCRARDLAPLATGFKWIEEPPTILITEE